MNLTQQILKSLPPRFSDFSYYQIVLDKITENRESNPDIAIESCKSLIEGLSKSILKHTDKSYISDRTPDGDFTPLFKKAVSSLASRGGNIEDAFTNAVRNLIHQLGTLRNSRGDISHGRSAPKLISSSPHLSNLVVQSTDGLSAFLLHELFSLDLTDIDPIKYGDNVEFNIYLDELIAIGGGISYSRALFDQDFVAYEEQLREFESEREKEREQEILESTYIDYLIDMRPLPSPSEDVPDPEE